MTVMTQDLMSDGEFDLAGFLANTDERLLEIAEGRRVLTRLDPILFAILYMRHHLMMDGKLSLSEAHLELVDIARDWVIPNRVIGDGRHAVIDPRELGKTTWMFLILPMWAAAHGHLKFIAAFADSASQAEQHLATFKAELDNNQLLRADFPELCTAETRPNGTLVADNRNLLVSSNGFAFSAQGIDTSSLGKKIGSQRPDLLLLDDIERDEGRYSEGGVRKRLGTILDAILPLAIKAKVVLIGTVTMPNSIMHQLVKSVKTNEVEDWITETGFTVHYNQAIVTAPDGSRRSLWPAKWSLQWLESIEHTRMYLKNYANDPIGNDGEFWQLEDFTHLDVGETTHQLLSIDPAVTTKATSDYTGMAVLSWSPTRRCHSVDDALHVKIAPGPKFRDKVLQILADHPGIRLILVETNQGGDTWRAILHNMPVPVETKHQSERKTERATQLLNHYQARPNSHVVHRQRFPDLEAEMVTYPRGLNDDLVDAVGTGVEFNEQRLSQARRPKQRPPHSASWVG